MYLSDFRVQDNTRAIGRLACINMPAERKWVSQPNISMKLRSINEAGYTLLELLYVVSIVSLLIALLVPRLIVQRNKAIEAKAQRSLRSIGSVMTDYALTDREGNYGDFQDLKDAHMISPHITASSIIIDYSLVVTTRGLAGGFGTTGYTIIAYPRPERSYGRLSTFAITEDNVVRVYKPGPGVSFTDPTTWPPIL